MPFCSVSWFCVILAGTNFHIESCCGSLYHQKFDPLTFFAAGTVAAAMGLPIRLISCVNENDFLYRMINQGILSSGPVQQTFASAMDIQVKIRRLIFTLYRASNFFDSYHFFQVPYNIERILHISSGQNVGLIQTIYNTLAKEGLVQLPSELLTKVSLEKAVQHEVPFRYANQIQVTN